MEAGQLSVSLSNVVSVVRRSKVEVTWFHVFLPVELRRERRFHSLLDVVFENVRRQTFTNWPVAFIDPGQLAQAGFFYLQKHDHVQCAFCRGVVGYWDLSDNPFEEHRKHFSSCRFVSGLPTGNVPLYHPADDTGRVYRLLEEYHQFRVSSTRPVGSAYRSGECGLFMSQVTVFVTR